MFIIFIYTSGRSSSSHRTTDNTNCVVLYRSVAVIVVHTWRRTSSRRNNVCAINIVVRPRRRCVWSSRVFDGHVSRKQQVQRLDFRVGLRNAEIIWNIRSRDSIILISKTACRRVVFHRLAGRMNVSREFRRARSNDKTRIRTKRFKSNWD